MSKITADTVAYRTSLVRQQLGLVGEAETLVWTCETFKIGVKQANRYITSAQAQIAQVALQTKEEHAKMWWSMAMSTFKGGSGSTKAQILRLMGRMAGLEAPKVIQVQTAAPTSDALEAILRDSTRLSAELALDATHLALNESTTDDDARQADEAGSHSERADDEPPQP